MSKNAAFWGFFEDSLPQCFAKNSSPPNLRLRLQHLSIFAGKKTHGNIDEVMATFPIMATLPVVSKRRNGRRETAGPRSDVEGALFCSVVKSGYRCLRGTKTDSATRLYDI